MTSRRTYQLQRSGNLLFLKATVGSHEPSIEPILVRLLVDTGSSFTVLPSRVLADVGCDLQQPRTKVSIVAAGGVIQVPVVAVPWLNCLGQRVENFPVVVLNLPLQTFTNGLLGMDFLNQFGAVIDTKRGVIDLVAEIR
jgi:aspartyl protease family protein